MNEKIKDSGSSQNFTTGAHRDNPTGKGRCDLLPLDCVAMVMNDPVINEIEAFMSSRDPKHLANAIRNSVETVSVFHYDAIRQHMIAHGIEMCDMIDTNTPEGKNAVLTACMSHMMLEASKLYEAGAIKYGANNWKLGMPVNRYIDSGIRHYFKTLRGDIDEPHYRGFVWNILSGMWTAIHCPEMNFSEEPERRDT